MQTDRLFKLSTRRKFAGGAALAMIATLLVVAATTLAIRMTRQVEDRTERVSKTQARMERIRAALHAYAVTQGRLPCPVAGATPDNSPTGAGLAAPPGPSVTTCAARDGTVPWVSLGLRSEEAQDAWGRKISYRVFDDLVRDDGVKNTASTNGLSVEDEAPNWFAWVLISHGVSGLGAWLPNGQPILPTPASKELANTQPTGPFVRREESVVDLDPATSPNHFDDVLMYESIEDLKNRSGFDLNTRMTTRRLDSGPGGKITYTDRNSNTASITFDSATSWGVMNVASTGGNISRNADGTGIGVCSGLCDTDANSALDNSKALSFKLSGGKTADKFALGVLSLEPTVEVSITYIKNSPPMPPTNLGTVDYPIPPASPLGASPGVIAVFENTQPNPPAAFDEVVIRPKGTSRFFIASIRFCTAAENCN